jgi:hypothetical protein
VPITRVLAGDEGFYTDLRVIWPVWQKFLANTALNTIAVAPDAKVRPCSGITIVNRSFSLITL